MNKSAFAIAEEVFREERALKVAVSGSPKPNDLKLAADLLLLLLRSAIQHEPDALNALLKTALAPTFEQLMTAVAEPESHRANTRTNEEAVLAEPSDPVSESGY